MVTAMALSTPGPRAVMSAACGLLARYATIGLKWSRKYFTVFRLINLHLRFRDKMERSRALGV